MSETSLYNKVVKITSEYLGVSADRFISRSIVDHLNKKPEKLKIPDLIELLNWIKPAMGILTEDSLLVDKYLREMNKLIESFTNKTEDGTGLDVNNNTH
jgi:hypothetical protein